MRDAEDKGILTTPKTSQPSMGLFKKAFDEALEKSDNVICITISSGISGAYNSAVQAKKMFDEETQKKIFVIDSYNADAGESLLAIQAAEMAEREQAIENIVKSINDFVPKTYLFGMVEAPKWLEANGRISHGLSVILAQMHKMGMRPILSMKDGLVKPANLRMQARDTANALFKQLEGVIKKPIEQGKKCRVAISHADSLAEAQKLRSLIEEKYPQAKVDFISLTSVVIGAHVGPGTLICCSLQE